jgi:hypothetical protein
LRRTPAPSITGCGVMTRSTVRAWLFMLRSSGGVVVATAFPGRPRENHRRDG